MGAALGSVKRLAMNYNFERRAFKVVDNAKKNKPINPPRHKTEKDIIDGIARDYPEIRKEIDQRHEQLAGFLKDVRVTSIDPPPERLRLEGSARAKPLDRTQHGENEFGYPDTPAHLIPPGKISLRQFFELLSAYQQNPERTTMERLLAEYPNLDESRMRLLLKHFAPFAHEQPLKLLSGTFNLDHLVREHYQNIHTENFEKVDQMFAIKSENSEIARQQAIEDEEAFKRRKKEQADREAAAHEIASGAADSTDSAQKIAKEDLSYGQKGSSRTR